MASQLDIYEFKSFRSFLRCHLEEKKLDNPRFSCGQWARTLGLGGTAVLTNILNGKRLPGKKVSQQLIKYFNFDKSRRDYLLNLIKLEKYVDDPTLYVTLLEKLSRQKTTKAGQMLDSRTFNAISKWYYYAIREMTHVKGFKPYPHAISCRLKNKVSKPEIKKALQELMDIGLLEKKPNGRMVSTDAMTETDNSIASQARARFLKHVIEMGKDAIDNTPRELREIGGTTFCVKKNDIPRIKEYLKNFRKTFCSLFEAETGDEVYQLNIQFFPLTEKKELTQVSKEEEFHENKTIH